MTGQQLNCDRIGVAIRFIKQNRREQPKREEVAEHVHMSPCHFQRTFQKWARTYRVGAAKKEPSNPCR